MRSVFLSAALATVLIATPALGQESAPAPAIGSPKGPGGRNITAFDRHAQSGLGGYYDVELRLPFNAAPGFTAFDLHHLILQTSSHPHDRLFFNAEIEFERGGVIKGGEPRGPFNDGELRIEQAWADYSVSDELAVRAGVVLIPFGIVNVLHDSDVRETTTRPLLADGIIPTTWSEPGFGLVGLLYPDDHWQVSYEGYVTQGLRDAVSPALGLRAARPSMSVDTNGNKAVTGRVGLSPFLGLEVGLDGYYGAYDPAGEKHLGMLGADAAWTLGNSELVAEFAHVGTEGGTSITTGVPAAIPTAMDGFYLEGRHRFFPEWLRPLNQGTFSAATFTLVGRCGYADTNRAAFDASDRLEALIGINLRPIQTFVIKLEALRIAEPATGRENDTVWSSVAAGF